ncbi:MAG: hypothetical protein IT287_06255 [Bdellovibrionaceae bacterium]|nr:hypothetical protein [Pseudobdellovibrionaceae bacterium]
MILYILFLSQLNFAQVGTTADALGGAGVANAIATESAFLNPAGLGFHSDVQVAGVFRTGKSQLGDFRQFNAVIADANPGNLFVGSLAYRQRNYDAGPTSDIEDKEMIINAAYRLRPEFAMGLRGYKKQTDFFGVKQDEVNSDFGMQLVPMNNWTIGFTQYSMFSTKDNLAYPLGLLPMSTVGVQYVLSQMIAFNADLSYAYKQNNQDRFAHAVGVSFMHVEYFRINVGGRFDDRAGETAYTAGFQFYGPNLKVGYAYQKEVRQELGEVHTFDISLNL